jgi:hypothetical protein
MPKVGDVPIGRSAFLYSASSGPASSNRVKPEVQVNQTKSKWIKAECRGPRDCDDCRFEIADLKGAGVRSSNYARTDYFSEIADRSESGARYILVVRVRTFQKPAVL